MASIALQHILLCTVLLGSLCLVKSDTCAPLGAHNCLSAFVTAAKSDACAAGNDFNKCMDNLNCPPSMQSLMHQNLQIVRDQMMKDGSANGGDVVVVSSLTSILAVLTALWMRL